MKNVVLQQKMIKLSKKAVKTEIEKVMVKPAVVYGK
jgi:hypothetical protein